MCGAVVSGVKLIVTCAGNNGDVFALGISDCRFNRFAAESECADADIDNVGTVIGGIDNAVNNVDERGCF